MLPKFDQHFKITTNSYEDETCWNECLFCSSSFPPQTLFKDKTRVEILSDLFNTFSKYMKWDSPPERYQFDFLEEEFPFCSSCSHKLVRVFKLDEQIQNIISNVIASILTSDEQEVSKTKNKGDGASEKIAFYRRQTKCQHQPEPFVLPEPAVESAKQDLMENGTCTFDLDLTESCSTTAEETILSKCSTPGPDSLSTDTPGAKMSRFPEIQQIGPTKFIYDNKYIFSRSQNLWQCVACETSYSTKCDLFLHWETGPCFSSEQPIEIVETFPGPDDRPRTNSAQEPDDLSRPEKLPNAIPEDLRSNSKQLIGSRFVCVVCGDSFKAKQNLQRHTLTLHVDESCKAFPCGICGRKFATSSLLSYHLYTHKRKPCPVCGKIYSSSGVYVHMKQQHNNKGLVISSSGTFGLKEYKCKFCPGSFLSKRGLTMHLNKSCANAPTTTVVSKNPGRDPDKSSSPETPHRNKGFISSSINLSASSAHPKISCQLCRKTFANHSGLYKHVHVVHTPDKEKPFQCRVCAKKFAVKSLLKAHFKIHERVECDVCNEICSVNSLYSHKYIQHKLVDSSLCTKSYKADSFQEHVNWHKDQGSHVGTPASPYSQSRPEIRSRRCRQEDNITSAMLPGISGSSSSRGMKSQSSSDLTWEMDKRFAIKSIKQTSTYTTYTCEPPGI